MELVRYSTHAPYDASLAQSVCLHIVFLNRIRLCIYTFPGGENTDTKDNIRTVKIQEWFRGVDNFLEVGGAEAVA